MARGHGNRRHEARIPEVACRRLLEVASASTAMNNQQEALRKFAQQLQRASKGGGGFPGGSPRGLFAGGGLVIALIAGGIALNASLFNGGPSSRHYP